MTVATMPLDALPKASSNGLHVTATPDDAPTAQLITVTPQMARDLLANAHPNRPVSRARVKALARAIRLGLWVVNGATLVTCAANRLLDGQHRLSAILEAGKSVQSFITIGVDQSSFETMDQGKKRSGADVLAIGGQKQSQTLASALRWVWRFEHREMLSKTIALLDVELPTYLAQHPTIITSLDWGAQIQAMIPRGSAAMLFYFMAAKDPVAAKQFFTRLAKGLELAESDPEYLVRERFLHERKAAHHEAVVQRLALVVRAWNCRRGTGRLPAGAWQGTSATFPAIA